MFDYQFTNFHFGAMLLDKKKRALCYITSYLKVLRKTRNKECNNSNTLYSVKPLYDLPSLLNLKISQVLKYKGSITLLMVNMS